VAGLLNVLECVQRVVVVVGGGGGGVVVTSVDPRSVLCTEIAAAGTICFSESEVLGRADENRLNLADAEHTEVDTA